MADAGVAGLPVAREGVLQVQLGREVGFLQPGEVGRMAAFEVGLVGAEARAGAVLDRGVAFAHEACLGGAEGDEADLLLELGAAEGVEARAGLRAGDGGRGRGIGVDFTGGTFGGAPSCWWGWGG